MALTDRQQQIRALTRRANLLAIACLPILLWQAWRLSHAVLRLHEAQDTSGIAEGNKPTFRLLIIGESTSTGVGADSNYEALAGHLARALATRLRRSVHWQVFGQNGFVARQTRQQFCPQVATEHVDLVVIVHGFNDTVGWTSCATWRKELRLIVNSLAPRLDHPMFVLSGIPPFREFKALPQPMRSILAMRADALELAGDEVADDMENLRHIKLDALPGAEYYCVDGFHPSAKGYAQWAEKLAEAIASES